MTASNKTETTNTDINRKPRQKKAPGVKGGFITSEKLEMILNEQRERFTALVAESHAQLKKAIEQNQLSLSHDLIGLVTHIKTLEDKITSLMANPGSAGPRPTNPFPTFTPQPFPTPSFPMHGNGQFGVNYTSLRNALLSFNSEFPAFVPYIRDTSPKGLILDIAVPIPGTMTGTEFAKRLDSVISQTDIYKTVYLGARMSGLHVALTSIEQLKEWSRNRHAEVFNQEPYSWNNIKQTETGTTSNCLPFSLMGVITELKNSKMPFVRVLNFDFKFERVQMGYGSVTAIALVYSKRDEGVLSLNELADKLEVKLQEQTEALFLNKTDTSEKPFFVMPYSEGPLSMIQNATSLINWLDCVKKD